MVRGMKIGWAMVFVAAVVLAVGPGCRGRGRTRGPGRGEPGPGDVGRIDDVDWDIGMGDERQEFGEAVRGQFDTVFFGLDSSGIQPAERAKVERVADYLRRNPGVSILVEGHCCERGSAEYNLALGERRALAVRAYLVGLGVDPERIQTVSFGEERPAVQGTGEHILRQNRRAEFVVVY